MLKTSGASLFWKCLATHSRQITANFKSIQSIPVALNKAPSDQYNCQLFSILKRGFFTTIDCSSDNAPSSSAVLPPPKRSPNVFALFVKSAFKKLPSDMPIKEKFIRAAEEWRVLPEDQKQEYKKQMTDGLVQYRQQMSAYLDSLTPEELADYKKLRKNKIKEKTRQRIKVHLRKLKYPKKPCSAYIFFIRDQLHKEYPDGKYPPVKTPEHIRSIGIWSQRWRAMNSEERKPFADIAEKDRMRYFEELEKWKHDLSKPENEEDLLKLERLSRKVENANKSDEEVKKRQRKIAGKIIRSRIAKKTKKLIKAKKTTISKALKTKKGGTSTKTGKLTGKNLTSTETE